MTNSANASLLQEECEFPFGYTARFEWSLPEGMAVRWHPEPPVIKTSRGRAKFFKAYREKRNAFHQQVANLLGARIAIMDVLPDGEGYGLCVFDPATIH